MLTTAKLALAATLVLSATLAASAASKAAAAQNGQAAAYDVIPGYGKDGGRVAVPNPNR
jgi:hypothetical protein